MPENDSIFHILLSSVVSVGGVGNVNTNLSSKLSISPLELKNSISHSGRSCLALSN